jgi:hypothetical protein
MPIALRDMPTRAASGAFILHAGLEKWKAGEDTVSGIHGMAVGAYPLLAKIPPRTFVNVLAAAEIAVGAVLLVPLVPNRVAGPALTALAVGLLGLYFRTPGLRQPGSVWPTQAGTGVSKDVWLLGTGLTLAADAFRRPEVSR